MGLELPGGVDKQWILGEVDPSSEFGGEMTMGGTDQRRFVAPITYIQSQARPSGSSRAPEIRRVSPAPDTHLNFEMADTWAAGTLAHEIFTGQNPFYQLLSSETYSQRDLPILPLRIIEPIHRIVDEMLSVDPQQRPNPAVAANVVAVSLLRFGHDVRTFLRECGTELISLTCENIRPVLKRASVSKLKDRMNNKLRHLAELYATETITLQLANSPKISAAELQLRATFLSRLDSGELHSAMKYFIGPDSSLSFGTDDGAQLTINHQMAN
uniref:non-specific serine/threonine protein kinase n=1 Tax=Globodera rostochiensis TaxID=31243 RepID=A0A914H9U2_GLORO